MGLAGKARRSACLSAQQARHTAQAAARRKALAQQRGHADSHTIASAFHPSPEPTMHTSITARLASLSIASVMTLFMLVAINTLATGEHSGQTMATSSQERSASAVQV